MTDHPDQPSVPVDAGQAVEPPGAPVPAASGFADSTSSEPVEAELGEPAPRRWYDRIGIITGIVLFLLAVAGLIFLAAIGFSPALYLLVLVAVGVFLVIQGTRLHGPRRSSS
jgi:hypothetical protein